MTDVYKLTYFNARVLGESIRYIFALAEVDYEDHRIEFAEWPALKPTTKWGQIPVLEINGEKLGQSLAIGRYLARKYKLAGETPMEEFQADELIETIAETNGKLLGIYTAYMAQDEAKIAKLVKDFIETDAKPLLAKIQVLKVKNGGKWIVGKNVTWADVHLAHALDKFQRLESTVLSEFPELKLHQDNFFQLPKVKKWIETRPQTQL